MKGILLPFLTFFLLSATAHAQLPYQSDSVLVSTGNTLYEYGTDGTQRSQQPIPTNATNEQSRDLIVMNNSRVAVFNGTFSPLLSVFDGQNWTSNSIPGWSTPNNISYGGITSLGDYIFLSDGSTSGAEDQGIIVYDSSAGTYQRYFEQAPYIDLSIGQDGLLYALRDTYGALDVIDPVSMDLISSVDLGHTSGSRAVSADANGNIYMVSWNDYVAKYSASGTLLNTLPLGADPFDIDINDNGDVLIGGRFGDVYLTDLGLNGFSYFTVGSSSTFVAFAARQDVIPPPEMTASSVFSKGKYVTTLNWSTLADGVDVYLNGSVVDTFSGQSGSATYAVKHNRAQEFQVCNTGTTLCSDTYIPAP